MDDYPAVAAEGSVTKEQARCCQSRVDELGRPPIGYCSPECERRPSTGPKARRVSQGERPAKAARRVQDVGERRRAAAAEASV